MSAKIPITLNVDLTERQIVTLSQADFKNLSNSLDIINWHLEQMVNNGFDYGSYNIIKETLIKGSKK